MAQLMNNLVSKMTMKMVIMVKIIMRNFYYFVKEISQNCKKFGVNPPIVSIRVQDLLGCYSYDDNNNNNNNGHSLSFIANDENKYNEGNIVEHEQLKLPLEFKKPSDHT
jgi:hypothetical protein